MGHKRRSHTRRYPRRKDGTRRSGLVDVNGSNVNDSVNDGGCGCACLLIVIVPLIYLVRGIYHAIVN